MGFTRRAKAAMTWLKEIQDDSGILLFNARDYPPPIHRDLHG